MPALAWAATLIWIGSRSGVPSVPSPLPLDKVAHFGMYGLLGLLATAGWRRAGQRPRLLLVLALAALVGAADELNQRRIADRSPELADWIADTLGIAAASWLLLRYTKEDTRHVV